MSKLVARLRQRLGGGSIRSRIVLAFAFVILLIVALQVFNTMRVQASRAEEALGAKGAAICQLVAHDIRVAYDFDDRELVEDTFAGALQDSDLEAIALLDAEGEVYASGGDLEKLQFVDRPPLGKATRVVLDTRVLLFQPLGQEGSEEFVVASFSKETLHSQQRADLWTALAMGLLVLAVGTAVAFAVVQRSLTTPLKKATRFADSLAMGNIEASLESGSTDEIGTFMSRMGQSVEYLREMTAVAEAIAEGNLSVSVEPRSPSDRFGHAFRKMVESLRSIAGNLVSTSQGLAAASEELAASAQRMTSRGEEQSRDADSASSTMTEMAVQAKGISANAKDLASNVDRTVAEIQAVAGGVENVAERATVLAAASRKSASRVQSLIGSNQKIAEMIANVETVSKEMAERSEADVARVRELTGMIDKSSGDIALVLDIAEDIANRTRVLSINAALEAMRAGTAGRGFATVATGIKELAEKSRTALAEISSHMEGVQGQTAQVSAVAEEILQRGIDSVGRTSTLVSEVAAAAESQKEDADHVLDTTGEMTSVTEEVAGTVQLQAGSVGELRQVSAGMRLATQSVADASAEQQQGTQHVLTTVEHIAALSAQNLSAAEEFSRSAGELERQAESLQRAAAAFKI